MAHKHSVYDSDTHLRINPTTRTFAIEGFTKNTIVQHDHNSERFTFELPRFIEGHDMLDCNSVQVHYLNVDAKTQETSSGVFVVTDLQESPDDENIVIFSWLISNNATKYVGSLNFCIRFACISDENTVDYAWNTAVNTAMRVTDGINNAEIIIQEYADVLEQWKEDITSNIYDFLPEHLQFGSEGVQTVEILPPTQMMLIEEANELNPTSIHALMNPIEGVEVGKTYTVNYNGTNYECVASEIVAGETPSGEPLVTTSLGNMSGMGGEDTGEPFGIAITPLELAVEQGMGAILNAYDKATSVTISISGEVEKIKKLDSKYIDAEWMAISTVQKNVLLDTTLSVGKSGYLELPADDYMWLLDLKVGDAVTVTCNGVEYKTTYKEFVTNNYDNTWHMVGNEQLIKKAYSGISEETEDTGEPFLIAFATNTTNGATSRYSYVIFDATVINAYESCNVVVFTTSEIVNELPTKYLPEHLQFGATKEYGEIMSERELMGGEDNMWVAVNSDGSLFDCPQLVIGSKLTVVYNGTPYETTVTEMQGMQAYGNVGLMSGGADTGEPFTGIIAEEDGMRMLIAVPLDGSTTITMSIAGEVEKVTTLDVKYAPRPFIVNISNGDVWTADKTYAEIYSAYSQGYQIYARLGSTVINLSFIDDWEVGFVQATANNIWNIKIDKEGNVSQNQLV